MQPSERDAADFQSSHPDIPWHKIIGQRNILAHEYKDIADKLVWAVAEEHIPALINQLTPLVPESSS